MKKSREDAIAEELAEMKGALMAILILSIRAYAKSEKISFSKAKKKVLQIAGDAYGQSIEKFFPDKNPFLNGD